MLFWMCKTIEQPPNSVQIQHAILRNFSGFPEHFGIDLIKIFNDELCPSPLLDEMEECQRKFRIVFKDEFKVSKFNHILDLLFHEFKDKHAKSHLEQFQGLSTSEKFQFEAYQRLQFSRCYDKCDFEDPNINRKYEAEFELYFIRRFEKEVL